MLPQEKEKKPLEIRLSHRKKSFILKSGTTEPTVIIIAKKAAVAEKKAGYMFRVLGVL